MNIQYFLKKREIMVEFTYTNAVRNEGPIVIWGLNFEKTKFESDKQIKDEKIKKELENDLDNYLHNYNDAKKKKIKI